MDRDLFVASARPRWQELEALLDGPLEDGAAWSALSAGYRAVVADLSRARGVDMPDDVVAYLDGLAGRAHNRLYGTRPRATADPLGFLRDEVPAQVRASWPWVLTSAVLFFGPWMVGMAGAMTTEDFARDVFGAEALRQWEQMYELPTDDRPLGESLTMTAFYVLNNVGIAFRCFATGLLGGLGSAFFLVTNGLFIGTVFGHLIHTGRGANLLGFVAPHAAWELLAIVLAGAAGLRMGGALIATEGRTRLGSLRAHAPEVYRLVAGASAMLLVAALLEGMFSASPLPMGLKVAFGALQIVAVVAWLGLSGLDRR